MGSPRKRGRDSDDDFRVESDSEESSAEEVQLHLSKKSPKKHSTPLSTPKSRSRLSKSASRSLDSEIEIVGETAQRETTRYSPDWPEEIETSPTTPKTPRRTAAEIEKSRKEAIERRQARMAASQPSMPMPTPSSGANEPDSTNSANDQPVNGRPRVSAAGVDPNLSPGSRAVRREEIQQRYRDFAQRHLGEYGYTVKEEVTTFGLSKRSRLGLDGQGFQPDERCTPEQRRALELVKEGRNVFLTGSAGVGKSFLLAEIRAMLEQDNKPFAVLATTGIAALQVGGATIHSWAGIQLGDSSVHELAQMISAFKKTRDRWTTTQVVIIDEISMMTPVLFSKLSLVGKLLRKDKRGWGGIQLVVVGDFFQLPPILDDKKLKCPRCNALGMRKLTIEEADLEPENVEGVPENDVYHCADSLNLGRAQRGCGLKVRARNFVFETDEWAECNFASLEFTKVFRQADEDFIRHLEKFRRGVVEEDSVKFIATCGSQLDSGDLGIKPTNLYALRRNVAMENRQAYDQLRGKEHKFQAIDDSKGPIGAAEKGRRLKDLQAETQVSLKEGTQVLLLANLDLDRGLANGSRGVIVGWEDANDYNARVRLQVESSPGGFSQSDSDKESAIRGWLKSQKQHVYPVVYWAAGTTTVVRPHVWKIELDSYNSCWRVQLPLQYGWALTIHKSQGQSLDAVHVQLGGCFEAGQAYVALSRCRTPEGMKVFDFKRELIRAHPTAVAFYAKIRQGVPFKEPPAKPINPLDWLDRNARQWSSDSAFWNRDDQPIVPRQPQIGQVGQPTAGTSNATVVEDEQFSQGQSATEGPAPTPLSEDPNSWIALLKRAAEAFVSSEYATQNLFEGEARRLVTQAFQQNAEDSTPASNGAPNSTNWLEYASSASLGRANSKNKKKNKKRFRNRGDF